jgi:hypothetical protein
MFSISNRLSPPRPPPNHHQGGDYALKRPTFAVVNDLANIAEQLPRDPDPKLIMTLRRAGSNSRKNLTFRPKKIEEALR